ncbi:MAG: hypothetical protein SynsKO_08500 [Synoicihabitans sp.]
MILAAASVAVAGGVGTYLVLAPNQTERILPALPPVPEFSSEPEILQQKLREAHATAATTGTLRSFADYARLLQANGFASAATQIWQVLINENSDDARWPYYLAHLRRDAGDTGETAQWLRRTVEINPDYSVAWLQLGDMALKSANFDLAKTYYGERLNRVAGDPYARMGLARIEHQEGNQDAAQTQLLKLVDDHPNFASAHNLLARMYRDNGDIEQAELHRWQGYRAGRFIAAEDPWMEALEDECYLPAKLFVIGMMDFQANRGDRGRSTYERAVEYDPLDPGNHELLGDLYKRLKEPELARASLRRSLELSAQQGSPPSLLATIHLAAVEREMFEFQSSRETAELGLTHHPKSPELFVELGLTLSALTETTPARDAFESAIKINPNDTAAHFHMGEWWLRKDETEEAIPHFEQSLVQQPTFAPSLRYLLQYTLGTDQLDRAKEHADTLLGAYYGDAEVRQLVAICYLRLGRRELQRGSVLNAIVPLQRAYQLDPEDVDIAFELGTLQLAQGNVKAAIPPLETLLEKRPEDARAHFFLAQSYLMDGRPRAARSLLEKGLELAEAAGNSGTAANIREMLAAISR